ncbi:MAG: glutathione S-transferase family protein [Candidatus Competibacterales bacterium]
MTDVILHHYPPSPVSEKIRAGFGLKGLTWRSCEQNRLPDRPELFAMTGGYRRIPVLQIGADLYCDTQCILRELECRYPEPSFFPHHSAGLPFALSRWTDGPMFELAFRVAFAPMADKLPPALVADRSRLYMGPHGDLAQELADLPHTLAQLRAMLGWVEERLAAEDTPPFLLGASPGMADLLVWYLVWFVRERYAEAQGFYSEFPGLLAWIERMTALGHGRSTPIAPGEALALAKDAAPKAPSHADPRDPQGLVPGQKVAITPLTDSGEAPVTGVTHAVGRDVLVLLHEHPDCGRVALHFPRVGYRVTPMTP